jgi:hypothetical protein
MSAWKRLDLYTKDIWSDLRKELTADPDAARQHDQDIAATGPRPGRRQTADQNGPKSPFRSTRTRPSP